MALGEAVSSRHMVLNVFFSANTRTHTHVRRSFFLVGKHQKGKTKVGKIGPIFYALTFPSCNELSFLLCIAFSLTLALFRSATALSPSRDVYPPSSSSVFFHFWRFRFYLSFVCYWHLVAVVVVDDEGKHSDCPVAVTKIAPITLESNENKKKDHIVDQPALPTGERKIYSII